jgi:type I restriction enzyme S subunit
MKTESLHNSSFTIQTFFEKFDQFADAPDAVVKMRELVLQLAVQGKLVVQDPTDEPASVLFERVCSARGRLADQGTLKTKVNLPGVAANDQLYPIPETWLWLPLNELAELVYGKLLPTSELLQTGFPVYGANGIIGNYSSYHYEDEMLLISCRGAYSGKPNISPQQSYVTNNSLVCEFFEPTACDIRFYHAVISVSPRERIVTGSAQPQVTVANAIKLPVPLPPIAEQKRIVAKVDQLMALCDQLEALQQERETQQAALARASLARFADAPTKANLDCIFHPTYTITPTDLRKSILTLAVQGKLVPQDSNDEPADEILQRSLSYFNQLVAARKLSAPKPLPPVLPDDVPFSLPIGWVWCRFGQIMRISSGDGLVAKEMNPGTIPVYGGNGVNGYHDTYNVAKRTLVIGRVGFYCGSIHVTPDKAWVTDNAFITTFDEDGFDMDFLSWLLKATDLRERDNATAQPVISGGKVYPTVLAIPPLGEQRRIVAKVEQLMALVDCLETQLGASRDTAAKLLSALVAELTTKD